MGLLRYAGLFLLFLLVYVLVLRPVKNQVMATIRALPERVHPAEGAHKAGAAGGESTTQGMSTAELENNLQRELSEVSSEVTRTVVLKKHLVEKIKKEPENATRLIQGWVRQG